MPTLRSRERGGGQIQYVMAHGQANAEVLQGQSPTLSLQHEHPIVAYPQVAQTLAGGSKQANSDITSGQQDANVVVAATSRTLRQGKEGGGKGYLELQDRAMTLGGQQQNISVAFTERTRADGRNFEAQEELAYALTNPGSGGRTNSRQVAGGFGVRRLTPTECERLQGFPDGWTEGQADSARYRQLGNAVAVPVVEWIARRIMEAA